MIEGILQDPIRIRETGNKPRPHGDYDVEWARCTSAAKELWLGINNRRLEIGKLALSVCEINHGGGDHWSGHTKIKTLKQFSKETGIEYKTLHTYVGVYKMIILLKDGEYDERNWGAIRRTFERTRKIKQEELKSGQLTEIYEEEKNRKGSTNKIRLCLKYIRSINKHLETIDWGVCSEEETNAFYEESETLAEFMSETFDVVD